jgi:uncharacterized protein YcbX
MGIIRNLYFYPVTALSPQPLGSVTLEAGRGVPFDRVFALASAKSASKAAADEERWFYPWQRKHRLFRFWRSERHVKLQTSFDPATCRFTILKEGQLVHESDISESEGIAAAAAFFAKMYGLGSDSELTMLRSDADHFTENPVSLINLASVQDFEQRIGRAVNPLRFRANIYFDGWPAWSELDLVGSEVAAGEARLRIVGRTQRCAVTTIDPVSGVRDLFVPRLLMDHYGHADLGVYAEVIGAGKVRALDPLYTL